MSYVASAYKVMIASPSDVARERLIAREVIHEWNSVHSEHHGIVLMPVGWESHSSPSMDAAAQDVITSQVLSGCDLLIGIFWTRIGTPTASAESGSAEEIRKHIGVNKPTMLYFSDTPVEPSSIDRNQYDALVRFRDECRAGGLVESFISTEQFRNKLTLQLAHTVIREFGTRVDSVLEPQVHREQPRLTNEARVLLWNASQDHNGAIIKVRAFGGMRVQTNGKIWPRSDNARRQATWASALEQLVAHGLAQDNGYSGEVFDLTARGFEVADTLGLVSDDYVD